MKNITLGELVSSIVQIVNAHAHGETIERRQWMCESWEPVENIPIHEWNWVTCEYRVRPGVKRNEWWLMTPPDSGHDCCEVFTVKPDLPENCFTNGSCVHVMEVAV